MNNIWQVLYNLPYKLF